MIQNVDPPVPGTMITTGQDLLIGYVPPLIFFINEAHSFLGKSWVRAL